MGSRLHLDCPQTKINLVDYCRPCSKTASHTAAVLLIVVVERSHFAVAPETAKYYEISLHGLAVFLFSALPQTVLSEVCVGSQSSCPSWSRLLKSSSVPCSSNNVCSESRHTVNYYIVQMTTQEALPNLF